ncbi:MAG TPA: acetyl-CoA carboxylase carboxyltransferase subunit, partial [Gammaproteobacteria bacterium]|nr:acetyl-CoA carboxylase carboxyltransferase subunit [Gammaproteobacteria bacterium]
EVAEWVKQQEAMYSAQYEKELMNPKEALSLGSISQLVMPYDLRSSLAQNLNFLLRHYEAKPMGGVQREFH